MRTETQWVFVYHYEYWDPETEQMKVSETAATLEAIRSGLGIPLLVTGRKVPIHTVGANGRVSNASPPGESTQPSN